MVNKYTTVARLMAKGKRVGFIVETTDPQSGKKHRIELSDDKIKQMMNNGETFDISFNHRGFFAKNRIKKISNLPIVNVDKKITLTKSVKHKVIIDEYTGVELERYIENQNINKFEKRDFVYGIIEYCENPANRVLSISGLRGTGKTTGVLQAIVNLNKYNETVFISIDKMANMDCLDLRELILAKYGDKKYIFIDEITRIKDLINNSGFLADLLCANGKRVVVSGTDSLGLIKAEGAGLYHRMIDINVTHISYAEAKRTMGQNLGKYIQIGGLYETDAVKDIEDLRRYVDTAVVDNIYNTLTKNKGTTGLLGLESINNKRKLRTLIFRIIYAIVYCNIRKSRPTDVKYLINLFDLSSTQLYTSKTLNSLVCSQMLVDENVVASQTEIQALLNAMEELGLLVKVVNIFNKAEINYYITNPSIVNQLIGSIVTILEQTGLNKKQGATVKGYRGTLFESIVVAHTKKVADKLGDTLYYYHDKDNREIDLIVEKETMDAFDNIYLYYEIKMTSDADTAVVKSKWINDINIDNFASTQGIVVGKGIIYGGNNKRFTGFVNSNIIPPKGMTLAQIEQQNYGIELISADEYLLHTFEKLQVLENYKLS